MMTFLTTELRFEKALRTLRMAFTGSELPSWWTFNTLIPARATACITAQVTLNTTTTIAVIAEMIMRMIILVRCQLFSRS
jgi:hypothetical protein